MRSVLFLAAVVLFINSGCIKKSDVTFKHIQADNWTPDWALPLLNSNLTLKNIVKPGDIITVDASGLYTLHYSGKLFTARAEDYIKIPDQDFHPPAFTPSTPFSSPSYSGTYTDSASTHVSYLDPSGTSLAHLVVKSGHIHVALTTSFKHNVSISITFPHVLKNGTPLTLSSAISYPGNTTAIDADLSDCTFDLTNGGSSTNDIAYKTNYTVTGTGQPVTPTDNISAAVSMTGLNYRFIDGFLGHYSFPIPGDTIRMNVFNDNITANLFLKNPKLNLKFTSSFGLAVAATMDNLFSLTNKGTSTPMTIPTLTINGAPALGSTANSNIAIDSTNSSIQYIFNTGPNQLAYSGHITLNPGTGTGYNFLADTSAITLVAEAELPACFKIIELTVGDTLKCMLPQDTSLLQRAEFKMLMDNSLPLYGGVQVCFADSNFVILDSLVTPNGNMLHEAPVDAYGVVTGHTVAITTFLMEHDKYNKMAPKVRYAFIRGNLRTSGTNTIQILDVNSLRVKLAFRFTLNVPTQTL